jgi:RHS repeat-associated protein
MKSLPSSYCVSELSFDELCYNTSYSFTFNGKEADPELVTGNVDFGARIYDSRLGKWMSVDKRYTKYPDFTPYCFAGNNPIIYKDVEGNDIVFFNNEGVEVHRIESSTVFRTFVTVPDANTISIDFDAVANNVENEPAQTGWMGAPMPGVIEGFEAPVYQQNDYLIAAETQTFNWTLMNDPGSLPTLPGNHELKDGGALPQSLDPTLVKAIEIQESGSTPRNGVYSGDVMFANYPGDWEATKDIKGSIGLSKGQTMDPKTSIDAGIKLLYLKGMKSDIAGKMEWRDPSGGWDGAVGNYNGGGVASYKAQVLARYNGAQLPDPANYIDPSATPAAAGGKASKAGKN